MNKHCKTCTFRLDNTCSLKYAQIDPERDTCRYHSKISISCEICGAELPPLAALIDLCPDGMHTICPRCDRLMSTCQLCDTAATCDFESNPIDLPKTIQKQIRQGNMVMMTEIKNPDRIRETCLVNCPCFSQENGCLREFNSQCTKFHHSWRKEDTI